MKARKVPFRRRFVRIKPGGFLRFPPGRLKAMGWSAGTQVTIESVGQDHLLIKRVSSVEEARLARFRKRLADALMRIPEVGLDSDFERS